MNEEKSQEELIEQKPELSPEATPEDALPEELLPEELLEDESETVIEATADDWQGAIDAIANDESYLRLQLYEDPVADEQSMDADLPDALDELDVEGEEVGTEEIRIIASDETISRESE